MHAHTRIVEISKKSIRLLLNDTQKNTLLVQEVATQKLYELHVLAVYAIKFHVFQFVQDSQ